MVRRERENEEETQTTMGEDRDSEEERETMGEERDNEEEKEMAMGEEKKTS